MVTQEKKQYGNWYRVDGKIEEIGDRIEETKRVLWNFALEDTEREGIKLNPDSVEWIIRQQYNNDDGTFFSDEPFEGAVPYVTVAWKAYAHG